MTNEMTNDHGKCPSCKADLTGASIWQTGYILALSNGGDTWPSVQAKSRKEAEARADKYAEAYGATRTLGRWGRAIGLTDLGADRILEWQCPDCGHKWKR